MPGISTTLQAGLIPRHSQPIQTALYKRRREKENKCEAEWVGSGERIWEEVGGCESDQKTLYKTLKELIKTLLKTMQIIIIKTVDHSQKKLKHLQCPQHSKKCSVFLRKIELES